MVKVLRFFLPIISLALAGVAPVKAQTIAMGSFSGTMTLNCSDFSSVPQVFPAITPVQYSANPATGECTVQFAGLACRGRLNANGSCTFGSEDCGGPVGWNCYVYYKGVEPGYGDVFVIRCDFPGDPLLSFSYSGSSSPDILGGSITTH